MKALYFENDPPRYALYRAARMVHPFPKLGPLSPVRYAEVPEPSPPNGRWLLVRNTACGLCGTDIHFLLMDMSPKSYSAALPGIKRKYLGHEAVGVVEAADAEADGFQRGDRVALRLDWPSCAQMEISPPCGPCAAGSYMLCENLGAAPMPEAVGGGFSPRMAVHRSQPFKIPDSVGDDTAVLLEPMACAVHGVLKAAERLAPGARVLVIGGGTIGLLAAAACRALAPGVEVFLSARYPFQARAAEALGARVLDGGGKLFAQSAAATGGRHARGLFGNEIVLGGFDAVLDSVGGGESFGQALRLARAGGMVVLLGINFAPASLDYSPVWAREVVVTGINCHGTERDGRSSFAVAAELLAGLPELPGLLITHRFPMREYRKAVRAFMDKGKSGAIKIVLEHGK